MAFNYKKGDTATGSQAVTFELDLKGGGEGDYEPVCVNSLSESLSYNVETWSDLCSKGFSSTAIVGMDPEWSAEMVIRYNHTSMELAKRRYDVNKMNNIPMRITNTFLNEIMTINVSISSFEMTVEASSLLKASFTIKPFEGAPVVKQIETETPAP